MVVVDTAAEIFLLLTSDDGGQESWGTQTSWALSAATIADLLLLGRVELGNERDPRVRVVDPTPTGRPVLDTVLTRAADKDGKRLSALVQDGRLNPEDEVIRSLVEARIIEVVPKRLLGLVPAKRPTLDHAPERAVRERLRTVLIGGQPSATDATLLAILQGLGVTKKVLSAESEGMSRRDLERRVEQACAEVPVGAALKRAIDALTAAILAAVIVPTVAGGVVSS